MKLTTAQESQALQLLGEYERLGLTVVYRGHTHSFKDFDKKRMDAIPEILQLLKKFLEGNVSLRSLKEDHDKLCKRHDYWGFAGFSGQMVLNQLTNWSNASGEMTLLLKDAFVLPLDRSEAAARIDSLASRVRHLLPEGKRLRLGALPYFVSYFWQIQAPAKVPVMYSSGSRVLVNLGVLREDNGLGAYFTQFWDIQDTLANLYAQHYELTDVNRYWFVEHVLWSHRQKHPEEIAPTPTSIPGGATTSAAKRKYMEFIPPVLQQFHERSLGEGNAIDFEHDVAKLFLMLGFRVEDLGQGRGREPDGIARCREHNYAILFDAKSSKGGYVIGTDDRAITEYIRRKERELRKDGYSSIYFVIVSSAFKGNLRHSIERIRRETSVKSVVLVTAEQGLRLLARRVEDPNAFDLEEFQTLLLDNGELEEESLDEFLEA